MGGSPVLRLGLLERHLDRLELCLVESSLSLLSFQLLLEEPVLVLQQHKSWVLEIVWVLVLAVILHKGCLSVMFELSTTITPFDHKSLLLVGLLRLEHQVVVVWLDP